ncbi:MAG: hypothetical protein OEN48_15485 [Betaproteobacteria bacterium]|nr:hypothetical protein [Gammaproteobacteria bacterium]MDH3438377.1 hypothetical protein [Betaproteobacteria bacterium]
MKRPVIVCCTLAFCGIGMAHASVPPQSLEEATFRAAAEAQRNARTLSEAQDRAVANYTRNKGRMAAAAKIEQANKAAAAEARDKRNKGRMAVRAKREQANAAAAGVTAEQKAKKEAKALARAQDRVVAYYKRSLGKGSDTVVAKAVKGVEKLTCFTGVRDRHARIGVQLVNGKVDYFAFYSKWKPRTCSIDVERNGSAGRWEDKGATSKVTLLEETGVLLIDRKSGGYRFVFRNVDRMRYCGMYGKINGSLTVMRGKKKCVVQGIMDGHQG